MPLQCIQTEIWKQKKNLFFHLQEISLFQTSALILLYLQGLLYPLLTYSNFSSQQIAEE